LKGQIFISALVGRIAGFALGQEYSYN